jgi:NAD(P)-dependent dehydrogenase (short-subunit alcohol dehydrogenase family)
MKTAIITGSEGQLGQAFSNKLKMMKYNVIGFDCAKKVNKDIDFYKVDITNKNEINATLDSINGQVDLLINNAGVSTFSPFEKRTEEELDWVMGVNLKGPILLTQAVFNRYFKPQNKGCIINIGSIYGIVSGDMRLYSDKDRRTPEIYGATKAAIINITKYFAAYMAPNNIRVNCISPGGIFNNQDKEFVKKYSNKVPVGRMGNSDDLLSALEYLISNNSSYVTGQNIIIDGGFTSW